MKATTETNNELARYFDLDHTQNVFRSLPDFLPTDINTLFLLCTFAATHGITIPSHILQEFDLKAFTWDQLEIARAREYFIQIVMADDPAQGFEAMRQSGILAVVLPELYACYGVTQNKYHRYDVYYHSIYACAQADRDLLIRIAALFHDIGKPIVKRNHAELTEEGEKVTFYNHEYYSVKFTRKILQRFGFELDFIKDVLHLIRHHMFHYTEEWSNSAVRRLIRQVGEEHLDALFRLRKADRLGSGKKKGPSRKLDELRHHIDQVIEEDKRFTIRDLDIDGHVLMDALGLTPSPLLGQLLKYLYDKVIEQPTRNSRENLLELARTYLEEHQKEKTK